MSSPEGEQEQHGTFFIPHDPDAIEAGDHESIPAGLLVKAWQCADCLQIQEFDPPQKFVDVVEKALAHDRTCDQVPKLC